MKFDLIFDSVEALALALEEAKNAHSEHESRTGETDSNWPRWYAQYLFDNYRAFEQKGFLNETVGYVQKKDLGI